MSNYELRQHKKSDKIKWVLTGIAFVLVAVMLTGICLQLFGTGKQKPSEWFKKPDTEQTTTEIPDDGEIMTGADGAFVSGSANNGIKLMSARIATADYEENGISPQADTAYTLTATIEPADADNKEVDFSIAWKNPSSAWASGKNISDYLTLAQSANGGLTATLTCKQAFGEQAIVTVVARAATNVKATATVDYRKKLLNVTGGIFDGSVSSTKTWNVSTTSTLNVPTNYVWSVGTIEDTVKSKSMTVSVSSSLKTSLNAQYTSTSVRNVYNRNVTYSEYLKWGLYTNGIFTSGGPHNSTGLDGEQGLFAFCSDLYDYGAEEMLSAEYNKLRTCLSSCTNDLIILISAETNGGVTYSASYNVNILDSSLAIMPTSATLSNSSFVF